MQKSSHLRAILYALTGFTLWMVGDIFMKLLDEMGVPKYQIMCIGGLSGMIMLFVVTAFRGELPKLHPQKPRILFILAVLFLMNYAIWLTALGHLSLVAFYTVLFLAPTTGAVFAAVFLRERLDLRKILAIIAGFAGVVIAVNPVYLLNGHGDWIGYGAAFIGMFVVVTQMLIMRAVGNHLSREAIAFYPRTLTIIVGGGIILVYGYAPMSLYGWLYCFSTGAIGSIGWLMMAQAYKIAPASTVAPFHYSQIITGGLMGYLIWHDVPSLHLVAGAAIIVMSGLYIAAHAHKAAQIANTLVEVP